MNHLLETPHGYYFRLAVPKDLQPILRRRELKKSLKTCNRTIATRQALFYASYWHHTFEQLRGTPVTEPLFTHLKNVQMSRTLDGEVRLTAEEMDPNNAENELKLLRGLHEIFSVPTAPAPPQAPLLSDVIPKYVAAKGTAWNQKYANGTHCSFFLAETFLGNKPVIDYTVDDRNLFAETVAKLPIGWASTDNYRTLDLDQIIQDNTGDTLSGRSVLNHLNKLKWLFEWLVTEKTIEKNPFDGFKFARTKSAAEERDRFTLTEIHTIFSDSTFQTPKSPDRYWIPLIALYTGMRMGEIAQLLIEDVTEQDDIMLFWITPEGGDGTKSVKTISSRRFVPVHQHLLDLGFRDYYDQMKSGTRLFPNVPYKNNGYSYLPSKHFGHLLARQKFQPRTGKSFHSFRHTVATVLTEAGATELSVAHLLGHVTATTMTGRRYVKKSDLRSRVRLLSTLDFSNELSEVVPYTSIGFEPEQPEDHKETDFFVNC